MALINMNFPLTLNQRVQGSNTARSRSRGARAVLSPCVRLSVRLKMISFDLKLLRAVA